MSYCPHITEKCSWGWDVTHICLESHSSETAGPSQWVPAVDLGAWTSPEISANIYSFLHRGLVLSRTQGGQCWLSAWGLKVYFVLSLGQALPWVPSCQWTLSPTSCCLSPCSQKPAASSIRGWVTDRGMAQLCLLWGIRGPQLWHLSPVGWGKRRWKRVVLNEPLLALAEGELGITSTCASVQWVSWQMEFVICQAWNLLSIVRTLLYGVSIFVWELQPVKEAS